ncbi:hypothetical protein TNCT_369361 [Trichonephila clavata]|uniref:Uncharacterized protein n=1 Tax=Trichonephila clavata TaxID=2740835 RepID=A0A8X6LUI7_TRICU|nr:hypothetical protein TNCT_369361 [Trichonephila clavata]
MKKEQAKQRYILSGRQVGIQSSNPVVIPVDKLSSLSEGFRWILWRITGEVNDITINHIVLGQHLKWETVAEAFNT